MKKHLSLVLSIALLLGMVAPSWGQTSTEGKEFWVALLMANSPSGFSGSTFNPFIAISAKKACKVTVSNPSQGWSQPERTVQADSWLIIDDIPNERWYDQNWDAQSASEVVTKLGIKVDATEDVSVYAAIRMEYSYDASNILPTTALQSEYIIQDYPTYNSDGHKDDGSTIPEKQAHSIFTILATEDNTTVAITPSIATIKGKPANQRFTVDLKKGETYQVVSSPELSFSGTRVQAYATTDHSAPKPIAVFQGADFTQVPGGKSARDCLYEQAMPLDYWGTEFVVTRSVERDANRIRITAGDNQAQVYIDGNPSPVATIKAGDTWEFEMSENLASTEMASAITHKKVQREIPPILTGDAHYIKTSCPVAVYSYDVSSDYRFDATNKIGDPSMVWISPLQQRIGKITFGACGTAGSTGHTNRHYVNIVCLTADVDNISLSSEQRKSIAMDFQPVQGNPTYSYARVFLVDTDGSNPDKVYTLSSSNGVIAHVYGSGNNESYAYSVGSATVKQGISVGGFIFTDGTVSKEKFCLGNGPLTFDATVGTDNVTSVNWNFGDGISVSNAAAKMEHEYMNPGWYDVTAELFGAPACTVVSGRQPLLATISFSFYVGRPDTIHVIDTICVDENYTGDETTLDTTYIRCDTVVITHNLVLHKSHYDYDVVAPDAAVVNGVEYTTSQQITWTTKNSEGCDSTITCNLTIVKCLNMQIENKPEDQQVCDNDDDLAIPFSISRDGNYIHVYLYKVQHDPTTELGYRLIDKTEVNVEKKSEEGDRALGLLHLPIRSWKPGRYVGCIQMEDANCKNEHGQPAIEQSPALDITVKYDSTIFAFKFNNVLAVYQNKGYIFTAYQWYRNGEAIPGATASIYHTEEIFTPGDEYYVELKDNNGIILPSCSFTVPAKEDLDDYNPKKDAPAATKALKNNRMCIIIDDRVYDMFGQRIQ